jgi:LEA14-like dessication related protein
MMGARYFAFAVSILVGFLASSGCSTVAERILEKPKVTLQQVKVREIGVSGATVVFNVMVDNPNPVGINLRQLTYDVEIGGRALTSGVMEKGVRIEAMEKSLVEIPIPVRFSDVFASAVDVMKNGTRTYRVRGSASFGPFSIPFDETGELKFKR